MIQPHYSVGLSSALAPTPAPALASCLGTFSVASRRDLAPQVQSVGLSYSDNDLDPAVPISFVHIELVPLEVDDCALVGGLECTSTVIAIP
jgi:hypothetical protein